MTEWQSYPGDRLVVHRNDYSVIVPNDHLPGTPLACPVCTVLLRTREDETEYATFGCCHMCAMRWAHSRREAWFGGWRPSVDAVEDDVRGRPGLTVVLEVD